MNKNFNALNIMILCCLHVVLILLTVQRKDLLNSRQLISLHVSNQKEFQIIVEPGSEMYGHYFCPFGIWICTYVCTDMAFTSGNLPVRSTKNGELISFPGS